MSLSPAITRTLVDLELADDLVGRSGFCRSVDQSIPAVGDLSSIDYEVLVRLQPTHVLVQPPSTGVDPELQRLCDTSGWALGQWELDELADIRRLVTELPDLLDAGAAVTERSTGLIEAIDDRLAPGPDVLDELWTGRVMLVSNVDPLWVYGTETYLHELLVGLGCSNAVSVRGWATISLEDATRVDPEAIVIVSGAADAASVDRGSIDDLDVAAVRAGRVTVLADPDAVLPSSAVVQIGRRLESIMRSFAAGSGS